MITPILKDPKAHGGTLYTFPSASRDLTRSFSNSEYEFAFSHFACLNLPDFRYGLKFLWWAYNTYIMRKIKTITIVWQMQFHLTFTQNRMIGKLKKKNTHPEN